MNSTNEEMLEKPKACRRSNKIASFLSRENADSAKVLH